MACGRLQGAECNPGACYKYLGVQEEEVQRLAGLKEGCNDDVEYINVQRSADFHVLGQELSSQAVLEALEATKVPLGHQGEIAMKWIKARLPRPSHVGYMHCMPRSCQCRLAQVKGQTECCCH